MHQPAPHAADSRVAGHEYGAPAFLVLGVEAKFVEAALLAERGAEIVGYERGRVVAPPSEGVGEGRDVRTDPVRSTDGAVPRRHEARQERSRGGECPRALRARIVEDDGAGSEGVQPWGCRTPVAVTAEMVGPERVDQIDDDVRRSRRTRQRGGRGSLIVGVQSRGAYLDAVGRFPARPDEDSEPHDRTGERMEVGGDRAPLAVRPDAASPIEDDGRTAIRLRLDRELR